MTNDPRYELKFVTDQTEIARVRAWIRLHPERFQTAYTSRHVNSIYLDTPHINNLNDNLSGNRQRQKLRIRWYGNLDEIIQEPILELKYRDGYLGDKSRIPLANITLNQSWLHIMRQIRAELRDNADPIWHKRLPSTITPTIINRYKRDYFVSPDGHVRLTLDYDQQLFNQRLSTRPNLKFPLKTTPTLVIELKAPPQYSERLETAASQIPIRRNRNSKYVNAMHSAPH